jgi:radical SAM family uncharacterized protein
VKTISIGQIEKMLYHVQKPARYVGNELNSVHKNKEDVSIRFAFCFPDTYEIGMSHLGMKILYSLLNDQSDIWCERVFAPWLDMEAEMLKTGTKLFALESQDSIDTFDFVGVTLQYELSYSNILYMLKLAQIPLLSKDRGEDAPIVIAGGPCAYNCEPIADFLDLVVLGEGEEVVLQLMDLYRLCKKEKVLKADFLRRAAQIPGIYVPSLYEVSYKENGAIAAVVPKYDDVPAKVKKVLVKNLDECYYPKQFVVPSIETVHDRVMLEVFRGCIRGCRFCQAGMIYRPVREKGLEVLNRQAKELQESSGYEEISLASLSTSDYTHLNELIDGLLLWTEEKKVNLALPSLRIDKFDPKLAAKIQKVRKSGLTFAPEAGSQRMRDVINKNITQEDIEKTAAIAFEGGYTSIKLYFMIGLPTETMEDIDAIADLARAVLDCYYRRGGQERKGRVNITVSASSFVPKPFTPFQWTGQCTVKELVEKQSRLKDKLRSKRISFHWHDVSTSYLEAVFAKGDRRLSQVLLEASERGCKFDGWDDQFRFDEYQKAFAACGLDPDFYAQRERSKDEVLPWDHIDPGVSRDFLWREWEKAHAAAVTPNCRESCSGCGLDCIGGGLD